MDHCDVVHIVNQMRPGGIETIVSDLVRHSRYEARIFSLEGTTPDLVGNWPGLASLADRVEGFSREPRLEPRLVLRIARRLRALRPRAVFLHRSNPLLYGGLAGRLAGVPSIVHVEHDVWHYSEPRRRNLLRWTVRLVRPVHFAVSDAIAERLHEMLPSAPIRVVPGGIDLARFRKGDRTAARQALALPSDASVIGTAGRLEAVKGHSVLIAAMPHIRSSAHLVIVGDGSERDNLERLATELGCAERVRFLGHRDDLERILPAFDMFCLPSLSEGLPRVVMEAQAADVPVVATDVGSVRRIVDPATGRLVDPADPAALAIAIEAQLDAPPTPGACRTFAEARFSITRMVAEYDDVTSSGTARLATSGGRRP